MRRPNFKLIKVDETENWLPEIVDRADRLYGVYLIDTSEVTHLCELAPSYCAYFLYTTCLGRTADKYYLDAEKLWDDIYEGDRDTPSVSYFHVSQVKEFAHDLGEHVDEFDDYDELVRDYIEYCNANHYV